MNKKALYVLIGLLIGALGIFVATRQRSAAETRVVVVAATSVPPTDTPVPLTVAPVSPTVTPIPPTITPEPWDAQVNALSNGLRELPHLNSKVMERLLGGSTVDLLAVTEDREWVQAIYALEDGSTITGWLQVDMLKLNVSLDDLTIDNETVFVRPTEIPLAERYIAHFVERGYEYYGEQDQYMLDAGRGVLVIKVTDTSQIVGYVMIEPMNDEEVAMVREHLIEAGEFLDPGHGWETIQSAFETIAMGLTDNGTAWARGREIHWLTLWQNATTNMVVFEFPNVPTYVGTPIDG